MHESRGFQPRPARCAEPGRPCNPMQERPVPTPPLKDLPRPAGRQPRPHVRSETATFFRVTWAADEQDVRAAQAVTLSAYRRGDGCAPHSAGQRARGTRRRRLGRLLRAPHRARPRRQRRRASGRGHLPGADAGHRAAHLWLLQPISVRSDAPAPAARSQVRTGPRMRGSAPAARRCHQGPAGGAGELHVARQHADPDRLRQRRAARRWAAGGGPVAPADTHARLAARVAGVPAPALAGRATRLPWQRGSASAGARPPSMWREGDGADGVGPEFNTADLPLLLHGTDLPRRLAAGAGPLAARD